MEMAPSSGGGGTKRTKDGTGGRTNLESDRLRFLFVWLFALRICHLATCLHLFSSDRSFQILLPYRLLQNLEDTKLIHRNLLHFYTLTTKIRKRN